MEKRSSETRNPYDMDKYSRMQDDLEALRNEMAKKNRDQLDMMYNLDMDNFSEDTKALFKKWANGSEEAITYFQTYINGNEAKWQSYAQWKTQTSESVASLEGRVTANESSITSLVQWKSQATNSIASIRQKANANESSINSLTAWKNNTADGAIQSIASIQQQANANGARIGLLVNSGGTGLTNSAAGIIMQAINGDQSSIKIKADKILFEGTAAFITARDLSDSGSAIVSGNRISLVTEYGSQYASSSLDFKMNYNNAGKKIATIQGGDLGSGQPNDARFRLKVETYRVKIGDYSYDTAIYLDAEGGISLISRAIYDSGIFITALRSYITLDAMDNTRIRANERYAMITHTPSTGSGVSNGVDYVFCTDGIYYNNKKIVDNTIEV